MAKRLVETSVGVLELDLEVYVEIDEYREEGVAIRRFSERGWAEDVAHVDSDDVSVTEESIADALASLGVGGEEAARIAADFLAEGRRREHAAREEMNDVLGDDVPWYRDWWWLGFLIAAGGPWLVGAAFLLWLLLDLVVL